MDGICDALDLPRRPVRTELRWIGGADPRDRLENYDEIVAALAARGWAWTTTSDDLLAGALKQAGPRKSLARQIDAKVSAPEQGLKQKA